MIYLLIFAWMNFAFCSSGEEKKRIVFIVNPISQENKKIKEIIDQNLDLHKYEYKIVYSQYAEHATQLAREALSDSADIVAAVGGDGTVNEVGKALIDSKAALAIIPVGSGNGLARHLGIPVGLSRGIKALNHAHSTLIDTAKMNDAIFLNVAGIGFDARVAHEFAYFGKRGLFSYSQIALKEFLKYEPQDYLITVDGKSFVKKAFILAFANSSQYGNDFHISPNACIDDGYLDLVVVDDIPLHIVPKLIYRLKQNTLDHSSHFETHPFKKITIEHPYIQAHVDGEPMAFHDSITITVQPKSLKVMVPAEVR